MNRPLENDLSKSLAQHIDAAAAVPEAAIAAAQHKLAARLQHVPQPVRGQNRRRLAFAGVAAVAVAAMLVLPLLPDSGRAFAAVRAHFTDFKTLAMQVQQHHNGALLQTTDMLVGADGSLRTDVGGQMSVVVDQARHEVMILLHEPREASITPLPNAQAKPEASLDWLKEIREFQGVAKRLKQTRMIDGREAQGWALDAGAMQLLLWVDAQGLPIAMEQAGAANMQIRYRFQFDVPVPPGHLSSIVPAGYTLVQRDED
jgi:hypothetical protein